MLILVAILLFALLLGLMYFGPKKGIFGGSEKTGKLGAEEDIPDCVRILYERLRTRMSKEHEKIDNKTIVQLHYAAWCPYCIKILGPWNQLKYELLENKDILMLEHNEDICRTVGINSVPALFKLKDGKICKYRGPRTIEDLRAWILTSTK